MSTLRLHTLASPYSKKTKRIGRGGKRGTFSGRGTKGQRSRAGRRIRPAERDLVIRIPKRRGFRNKSRTPKPIAVRLTLLAKLLADVFEKERAPVVFDRSTAERVGLVGKRDRRVLKVLGDGVVSFPLIVKGIGVSAKAREAILKAEGNVE